MSWFSRLLGKVAPSSVFDEPARIVGRAQVVVMDGEGVDTAEDYLPVIGEIAAITGGALRFEHVACYEDDDGERVVTLRQAGRTWTGHVRGSTDWIDDARLLAIMNRALAELGAAKRLHSIHHERWGQELGVVFADEAQLARLREAGYTIEGDPEPAPRADETLAADRVIHGLPFRAGTVVEYWRDPPFDEMAVTLAAPHDVAGLALPAGAEILFREDGVILCCVLDGKRVPFEGGAWQLDRAEDGY